METKHKIRARRKLKFKVSGELYGKERAGFTQPFLPSFTALGDSFRSRSSRKYDHHESDERAGFTLIELLVVISIISLLSSIMLVAFSDARISARDARRKRDVKEMVKAVQLYQIDNNALPPGEDDTAGVGINANWGEDFPNQGTGFIPALSQKGYISKNVFDMKDPYVGNILYMWSNGNMYNSSLLNQFCGPGAIPSAPGTPKGFIRVWLEKGPDPNYTYVSAYGYNIFCFY